MNLTEFKCPACNGQGKVVAEVTLLDLLKAYASVCERQASK
ncbi:hypothetical protein [Cognatishimia sp. MH4019]|nr:hypothetical protein [Cognatishimia sp. MH4019]